MYVMDRYTSIVVKKKLKKYLTALGRIHNLKKKSWRNEQKCREEALLRQKTLGGEKALGQLVKGNGFFFFCEGLEETSLEKKM